MNDAARIFKMLTPRAATRREGPASSVEYY